MSRIIFNYGLLKILFIVTLVVCIGMMFTDEYSIMPFLSRLITFFWLWVLFKHGTIRRTFYFKVILIFLAILIVGMLLKLEHLPGASLLISASIPGLAITYLIRTLNKEEKFLLDWIKLSWVIAVSFISLGILERFISREYGLISNVLFFVMIGVFCLNPKRHLLLTAKNYYSDGDHKV